MGILIRFAHFFVVLFAAMMLSNSAYSAGYTCSSTTKYTSCKAGYYLTGTSAGNTCAACPTGYTSVNGNTVVGSGSCYITCSAGTRVATAGEECTTPAGGWVTTAQHIVYNGKISPVTFCPAGYTYATSSTNSGAHDALTDCQVSVPSGQQITSNTIPARYIKVVSTGNTTNSGTHMLEIQAFTSNNATGTNLLSGKGGVGGTGLTYATDGSWARGGATTYATGSSGNPMIWDLGSTKNIGSIKFAMYTDGRTYHNVQIMVSTNNSTWTTVMDATEILTPSASANEAVLTSANVLIVSPKPTSCAAGTYRSGTTVKQATSSSMVSCTICPAGKYCTGGTANATDCPNGKYCPQGTTSADAAPACPVPTCSNVHDKQTDHGSNVQCVTPANASSWKTGLKDITECSAQTTWRSDWGVWYTNSRYNTSTQKFDEIVHYGPWFYPAAGRYLSGAKNFNPSYTYYENNIACPAGSYCPGKTTYAPANNGDTYGLESCPTPVFSGSYSGNSWVQDTDVIDPREFGFTDSKYNTRDSYTDCGYVIMYDSNSIGCTAGGYAFMFATSKDGYTGAVPAAPANSGLAAKPGYYVNGGYCSQCPEGFRGATSSNSGGEGNCVAEVAAGYYILHAAVTESGDYEVRECPTGYYCPGYSASNGYTLKEFDDTGGPKADGIIGRESCPSLDNLPGNSSDWWYVSYKSKSVEQCEAMYMGSPSGVCNGAYQECIVNAIDDQSWGTLSCTAYIDSADPNYTYYQPEEEKPFGYCACKPCTAGTGVDSCSGTFNADKEECVYSITPKAGYGNCTTTSGTSTVTASCLPTYTVNFNANGGTGSASPASRTCYYNSSCAAATVGTMAKTGHTLKGWSISKSATIASHQPGANMGTLTSEPGKVVNMYAVWEKNVYVVAPGFYLDGTDIKGCLEGYYCPGSEAYGLDYFTYNGGSQGLELCSDEGSGYFARSDLGATSYDNCYLYKGDYPGDRYSVEEDDLVNCGTGTYISSDNIEKVYPTSGEYYCDACTNKPEHSTYTGSAASNICPWKCDYGYIGADAISCIADRYTITYNLDGGTNNSANPSTYTIETNTITLANASKNGYIFAGWYDAATGGNKVTQIAKGSTGNKTLYARWTANNITASVSNKTFTYNGSKQVCSGGVTVSAPSSGATVTYSDSSNGTYASTVEKTNAGTYTIYYQVTANNYITKTGSYTCTINKANNPITLSSYSGSIAYPNSGTFTVNNAQGTLSVTSNATGTATATVSGTTVTVKSVKPNSTAATITVTAAGNGNYKSGSKTYAATVTKGSTCGLSLSATSGTIAYPNNGTFTVSGNRGTVTVTSGTTSVATATISNGTVTVKSVKPGSSTITVKDAGNDYYKECSKTYAATVTKGTNPITISATSGSTTYPTTKTFTVSNAQGTVSVSSSDTNVATASISGTTVTMTPKKSGSATITVTAAGNDYYNSGSKTYVLTVNKGGCGLTLTPTSGTIAYPNSGTFTVSGNRGAVTVSSNATGTATATISGNTVTVKSVKPNSTAATITVTDAGNDQYAGCSATYAATISKGTNPITISATSGSTTYPTTKTFTVSNAQGTVSVSSSDTNVATASISGTTVTMTPKKSGNATITVTAAGNDYYNSGSKTYALTVNKGGCGLVLNPTSGTIAYPNNGTFTVSGNKGTVTVSSNATGTATATISGNTVTVKSVKPNSTAATITVTDAGNDQYAGCSATYAATISKGTNPITISATSGSTTYPTTKTFTVSNAQGTVSVLSSDTNVATVTHSNGTVTMTPKKSGNATITVTAAGNDYYNSGSKTYVLTVNKGGCGLVLNPTSGTIAYPNSGTFTVSGNRGTVTVSSNATGTATATISGNTVTVKSVKPNSTAATITVTDAGNDQYAGCSATYAATISKGTITATPQNKTFTYNGSEQVCSGGVTVSAPSSGATVTYSDSSNGTYASTVKKTNAGTYTIYYKVTASNYNDKTGSYKCTINTKAMTVTKDNKTLTYNGSAQSCGGVVTVSDPSSGATIKYSLSSGGTYSTTAPTLTNADPNNPTTIYYQVTANNYTTTSGSYTCKMNKAACTLSLSASKGNASFPHNATFTYTGAKGTITATSNATGIATVSASNGTVTMTTKGGTGTATITVKDTGNSNYDGCEKVYALTVGCAACSATNAKCNLSTANNTCTYTTSCEPGWYNLQNNGKYNPSCSPCGDNNHYCPDGVNRNTVTAGYYSTGGTSTTRTGETKCDASHYCVAGVAKSCPVLTNFTASNGTHVLADILRYPTDAGFTDEKYQVRDNITDCMQELDVSTSNGCKVSNSFQFADENGNWLPPVAAPNNPMQAVEGYYADGGQCHACPAGSFCAGGAAGATKCAVGSYSTGATASCTACGGGKTTSGIGATSANSCTSCAAIDGLSTWLSSSWSNNNVSNLCKVDKCAANRYKNGNTCPTCASGTSSKYTLSNSGTTSVNSCYLKTDAGKYVKTAKAGQESCPANSFCVGNAVIYYGTGTTTGGSEVCPTGYTANTDLGKSLKTQCQISVAGGKYVGTAGDNGNTLDTCANWTYKGAHTVNYGSTSSCGACPALENGWTKRSGTGWTQLSDCKETKTSTAISTYCSAGVLTKTAATSTTWKETPDTTTALSAKAGAYVNGQTCTQCAAGSYCTGGTTAPQTCNVNYPNSDAGADADVDCYLVTAAKQWVKTAKAAPESCTAGYACPGGVQVNYGSTGGRSICTGATYAGAGAASCSNCPDGYAVNTSNGKTAATSCQATCSAGQRIVNKNEQCSSPAGAWFTDKAQTVNYGSVTTVNYCMDGFTSASAVATDHDSASDCKTSVAAGKYVTNTAPVRCIKITSKGSNENASTHIVELEVYESHDGTGTNLMASAPTSSNLNNGNWSRNDWQGPLNADLGEIKNVGSIKFAPYTNGRVYSDYSILISTDCENYVPALAPVEIATQNVATANPYMLVLASVQTDCAAGTYRSGTVTKSLTNAAVGCNACSALTGVSVGGGTYTSAAGSDESKDCKYTAPTPSKPSNCATITPNQVAYTGTAWPVSTFNVTANAGAIIKTNNVAAPTCEQCNGAVWSAGGTATSCSVCPDATTNWTRATGTGWSAVTQCYQTRTPDNCASGTIKQNATSTSAWGAASVTSQLSAKSNFFVGTTSCDACPTTYPKSDGGKIGDGMCYKTITKSGTQTTPSVPTNCATATWNACTPTSCTYKDYKDTTKTVVCDTWKNCAKTVNTVTANANAYKNTDGKSCSTCATGTSSKYTLSAGGDIGIGSCYLNTTAGKYVKTAGAGQESCVAGSYCPGGTKVWYNTTGGSVTTGGTNLCSALTGVSVGGGTYTSAAGSDESKDCKYTAPNKTITGCKTVTTNQVTYSGTAWPVTTYNVTATPGYSIANNGAAGATCTQCAAGSYCTGGTAAAKLCKDITNTNGFYPNSQKGSDADTDCYTNDLSGKYVATAKASSATACPNWTYKGANTVNYGSTSTCNGECPAVGDGWTQDKGTGWDSVTDCRRTQTPANCASGGVEQYATNSDTWGASKVTSALSANSKYYVNGAKCDACPAGSFCIGGTAAATKCAVGSYSTGTTASCTACGGGKTTTNTGTTSANSCANCSAIDGLSTWASSTWSNNSVSNLCAVDKCSANRYKSSNTCPTCASGTSNKYTLSNSGTTSVNSCYLKTTAGKYVKTAKNGEESCPANSFCVGSAVIYYGTGTTTGGSQTCASATNDKYTLSTTGASKVGQCYLNTAAGNWVATTGQGQVACTAGYACAGNVNVYYNADGGITTGERMQCAGATYSAAGASSCSEISDGYYGADCDVTMTVPAGYTQLEYLQGTGTQWVDTEYKMQVDDEIGVIARKTSDAYWMIYGGNGYTNVNTYFGYVNASKVYTMFSSFNDNVAYSMPTDKDIVVLNNKKKLVIDGKVIYTYPSTTVKPGTVPVWILKHGDRIGKNIIKRWWVTRDGALIRNMVPARRDSDNAIGMYDTVTQKFYKNSGAGTFVIGAEISGISAGCATQTQCTAGNYCDNGISNACVIGSYSANGASACTACTNGKTTSGIGKTSCDATCSNSNTNVKSWTGATWSNNKVANLCKISACQTCSATNANCSMTAASSNACTATTSCKGGYYNIQNNGKYNASCSDVTPGYYSPDGSNGRTACATGLTTIGYGFGADEAGDCGRIMHMGDNRLYLRSVKKTTPSLNVQIGDKTYYGNMTTADKLMSDGIGKSLKLQFNNTEYSVFDDSI